MVIRHTHKRIRRVEPRTKKARITVECSTEQRKAIRIMAAQQDQSMNDFIMALVEKEQQACHFCETYGPSEKTIKAIKQLENGENVEHHVSPEAFWSSFYREADDSGN